MDASAELEHGREAYAGQLWLDGELVLEPLELRMKRTNSSRLRAVFGPGMLAASCDSKSNVIIPTRVSTSPVLNGA